MKFFRKLLSGREKKGEDLQTNSTINTFELIQRVEKQIEVNRAQVASFGNQNNNVGVFPIDIWELIGTYMTYKQMCATLTPICKALTHMVYTTPCPHSVLKMQNMQDGSGYELLTCTFVQTPDRWVNIRRIINLCRKDKYTCILIANLFPNLEIFDAINNERNKKEMEIDDVTLAYLAMKCQKIRHVRFNIYNYPLEDSKDIPTIARLTDFSVNRLTIAGLAQFTKSPMFEDIEIVVHHCGEDLKRQSDLKSCTQCGKLFNPRNNTDTSCVYHPGKYSGYGNSCSSYNCCGSMAPPYPCAQGCKISRHTTEDLKEFAPPSYICAPEEFSFECYTRILLNSGAREDLKRGNQIM